MASKELRERRKERLLGRVAGACVPSRKKSLNFEIFRTKKLRLDPLNPTSRACDTSTKKVTKPCRVQVWLGGVVLRKHNFRDAHELSTSEEGTSFL